MGKLYYGDNLDILRNHLNDEFVRSGSMLEKY